jgi:hypothetical protein
MKIAGNARHLGMAILSSGFLLSVIVFPYQKAAGQGYPGAQGVAGQGYPGARGVATAPGRSHVTGALYAVQGNVQVTGWQNDLVRRNPSLARYNWAPITAAKPALVIFRQASPGQTAKNYHYIRPHVMTADEVENAREQKAFRAEAKARHYTNTSFSGRVGSSNSGQGLSNQAAARYTDTDINLYQPQGYNYAPAVYDQAIQGYLHGRLISAK